MLMIRQCIHSVVSDVEKSFVNNQMFVYLIVMYLISGNNYNKEQPFRKKYFNRLQSVSPVEFSNITGLLPLKQNPQRNKCPIQLIKYITLGLRRQAVDLKQLHSIHKPDQNNLICFQSNIKHVLQFQG